MTEPLTREQLARAGQAVFDRRKKQAKDSDMNYRIPMMYADYRWEDLPEKHREAYVELATDAARALGLPT